MRKFVVLVLLCGLLCFVPSVGSADPDDPHHDPPATDQPADPGNPLLDGMTPHRIFSAVRVGDTGGHGTGTVLNQMFVLTAYHVVDSEADIMVTLPYDERPIPATVEVHGDTEDLDYAVLRLNTADATQQRDGVILPQGMRGNPLKILYFLPPFPIEEYDELATGTHAHVAGYPLDFPLHLTEGDICSQSEGFITTSIPITSGNSGSAVVVKHDGREVISGVMVRVALSRRASQVYHISMMTRWDKIYADLQRQDCLYVLTGKDVPDRSRLSLLEEVPPMEPFMPDNPFGPDFGPNGPWGPDGRRSHPDGYRNFNPKRPTLRIEDMDNAEVLRVLQERIAAAE